MLWLRTFQASDGLTVYGTARTHDGGLVIAGTWKGTARFGAKKEQSLPLQAPARGALFVFRVSGAGELVWAKALGGKEFSPGYYAALAVGVDDSVFVGAGFSGTAALADMTTCTVSSSASVSTQSMDRAGVLVALAPNGEPRWAHVLGGWSDSSGMALAVAEDGDLAIAGSAGGVPDFGVGGPSGLMAPVRGVEEGVVARLGPDGVPRWARVLSAGGDAHFDRLTVLPDSSLVLAGSFYETGLNPKAAGGAVIQPGGRATLHASGGRDAVLARFDRGGKLLWARTLGGNENRRKTGFGFDSCGSLTAVPGGGVLITGELMLPARLGGAPISALRGNDTTGFVGKIDERGRLVWAIRTGDMVASRVEPTPDRGFLVVGNFRRKVRYPDAAGGLPLTAAGEMDLFLARHRPDGGLAWLGRFGGKGHSGGRNVFAHPDGSFTVVGDANGEVAFGDDPGAVRLRLSRGTPWYLVRFAPSAVFDAQPRERRLVAQALARRELRKTARHELEQGKYDAACAHFKELVDQDPSDGEAWVELGRAYGRASGHDADARRALQAALDVEGGDPEANATAREHAYTSLYDLGQRRLDAMAAGPSQPCTELPAEPRCQHKLWACMVSGPENGGRLGRSLEVARLAPTEELAKPDYLPQMPKMSALARAAGESDEEEAGGGSLPQAVDVLLSASPFTDGDEAKCTVVHADACTGTVGVVCELDTPGKDRRVTVDEFSMALPDDSH